jgi:hypothetical protein
MKTAVDLGCACAKGREKSLAAHVEEMIRGRWCAVSRKLAIRKVLADPKAQQLLSGAAAGDSVPRRGEPVAQINDPNATLGAAQRAFTRDEMHER